jgi:hypothetical protein
MPIFAACGSRSSGTASQVEVEETTVAGDRVVQRCRYEWGDGHVCAVDLYRVAAGKITEKLSYVKG